MILCSIKVVNISTKIKTNFFIIDEAFDKADSNNIDTVANLIKRMSSMYDWLLIISHDNSVKEHFDKIFQNTTTIKLENNYRSTPEIINMANGIIKNNSDQIDKKMLPNNPSGSIPIIKKYKNNTEQALNIISQIDTMIKKNIKLQK